MPIIWSFELRSSYALDFMRVYIPLVITTRNAIIENPEKIQNTGIFKKQQRGADVALCYLQTL